VVNGMCRIESINVGDSLVKILLIESALVFPGDIDDDNVGTER
jgi:hypothetical protein